MIFVAVIDIKIVATTGADLNHLVRNILMGDFMKLKLLLGFHYELFQSKLTILGNSKEKKLFLKKAYKLLYSFKWGRIEYNVLNTT